MSLTFTIEPRGEFSLEQAAEFLRNFPPACHNGMDDDGVLRLGFVADDMVTSVAVAMIQDDAGTVHVEAAGSNDLAATRRQVERIFSLDVDATGFDDIGEADPRIAMMQREFRGLRPVHFNSPYEAATWSMLANRMRMAQAACQRRQLIRDVGEVVHVAGRPVAVFPTPGRILAHSQITGLANERVARLRAAARAALDGDLAVAPLRDMDFDEAVTHLRSIRGIGPFYASLIYVRSTGVTDVMPSAAPRVRNALASAYGVLPELPEADIQRLAEVWSPFRTWVAVLITVCASRGSNNGKVAA